MLAMFTPASIEAQKVISMSIGKINASRITRTGTSLHRSLLVATVLHKARNVYLEEERERASRYPQCPTSPELTVTPVCQMPPCNNNSEQSSDNQLLLTATNNSKVVDSLICHEDQVYTPDHNSEESRLPVAEANTETSSSAAITMPTITTNTTTTVSAITSSITTTTTSNSSHARKRRRVSDQETAAAISSILPKRLRSELRDDVSQTSKQLELREEESQFTIKVDADRSTKVEERLSAPAVDNDCQPENLSKTADSDREAELSARLSPPPADNSKDQNDTTSSSDDSDSDDSDVSDTSVGEEMEVDQLTSLVSYFSFSQSQQKTDFCLQAAPHVVALTA